jgi:N-acyl-D-aspartate/D-glutamate deacylase
VYASTDEIAALALVAGKYGGGYFTHMRNEGDRLLEAIDEALAIGSQAGVPVHIFHLKTAGQHNWPKMELALARIKAARAAGQQVTADIYPYINNGLGITAFLHPRHSEEGVEALRRKLADPQTRRQMRLEMESETGWENWFHHVGQDWNRVIVAGMRAAPYHEHQGTPLGQIARRVNQDPWEVFFELCRSGAFAMPQSMSEANKCRAMCEPFVSFCTDVGPLVSGRSADHPRGWGSFPRALARYVRELGVIPLEQAVSQMTSLAANQLFQHDRGRLAPGLPADVVVFQLEELQDRATFSEPNLPADGVRCVIVNGKVVLEGGKLTGARPGRVLRGPGYVPQ